MRSMRLAQQALDLKHLIAVRPLRVWHDKQGCTCLIWGRAEPAQAALLKRPCLPDGLTNCDIHTGPLCALFSVQAAPCAAQERDAEVAGLQRQLAEFAEAEAPLPVYAFAGGPQVDEDGRERVAQLEKQLTLELQGRCSFLAGLVCRGLSDWSHHLCCACEHQTCLWLLLARRARSGQSRAQAPCSLMT